ncbi:MAG: MFS transporter [Candidatus Lokiarchaeota archaeon]|nr:MFS transporter [Candidatus Lokiarchaeota archaeon]
MTEKKKKEDVNSNQQPVSTMVSYGFGKFNFELVTGAFAALVFKYYEDNLGLSAGLAAIGIILYSIWNAINDPLIGHLTIKPTKLSAKYGRRFPWIFLGSIFWGFSFVLIFAVPNGIANNEFYTLLWMILTTCLYDTFGSLWEVNYQSVFPDKFRDKDERDKAAGIATAIGVFGIALGEIIPTLVIRGYEPKYSIDFVTNALIFMSLSILMSFIIIPGVRENDDMKKRYIKFIAEEEKEEQPSFWQQLVEALSERNFLAFILLYFLYQACTMSMTASVHYVGDHILGAIPQDTTIIFAGMLLGALGSVPLWTAISKKLGDHQKAIKIAAIWMIFATFPMTFLTTETQFLIALTIWGVGFGGFWMLITPVMADIIDEIVVKKGKRKDGIYLGFRAFFGRLSYAVQALTFWIVHDLTDYDPNNITELAKLGIHIHMALIPTIFLIVGLAIFHILNTLNKEKMEVIHKKLAELDL